MGADPFWSDEELEILIRKYPEYATAGIPVYLLTKELPGRSADAIEKKARILRSQGILKPYKDYATENPEEDLEQLNQVLIRHKDDVLILESPRGTRIKTLKDLIRECEIDEQRFIIRDHVINKWEVGAKDSSGEIVVEPLFQVKAWLKERKDIQALELGRERILEEIRGDAPVYIALPKLVEDGGYLLEPALFDVHLGRLAWAEETGGRDWDLKIAQKVYKWAITDLLAKAEPYLSKTKRVLFPIGQDFFHVDNSKGQTSAGTNVDHDGRWQKMFMAGYDCTRWAIDAILEKVKAPVDVMVISGNHDEELAFCLGALLEAWYHNASDVLVDNTPLKRKYYQFGNNMICLTHGRFEKHDSLPMIMAAEAPDIWGATKFREVHVGDLHFRKHTKYVSFEDKEGVGLRILPSLAEPDAWHAERGYGSKPRSAEAYIWDESNGLAATIHANRPVKS